MLNGALIGVLPRIRYILLTDALLERMPAAQLEAVMAHEIAHARRHHLPWLLVAMVSVVTVTSTGVWLIARVWLLGIDDVQQRIFWSDVVSGVAIGVALVLAFVCFGWISRRFERQADAFATQHLSGIRFRRNAEVPTDRCSIISGPAANAMKRALSTVAATSGIPIERFSFRHGSIAARQRAIDRLICRSARRLPIDRQVGRIKLAAVVLMLTAIGLSVLQVRLDEVDRRNMRAEAIDQWLDQADIPLWLRPGFVQMLEERQ
jgi:STE24 endopeptidase